ncbi:MAG: hypothetical protein RLZZ303_3360 [Candidatus Hydrogenedentota bacterium]|jgi:hypothetical protein
MKPHSLRIRCLSALLYLSGTLGLIGAPAQAAIVPDQVGYMGHETDYVAAVGNIVFTTVGDELLVLDVSNSVSPALLGTCSLLDENRVTLGRVAGLELEGDNLYVLRDNGPIALQVVDVIDPANPVVRGTYTPPASTTGFEQSTSGRSMTAQGNLVYIGVRSHGIYAVNCANPASPTQVSSFDLSPGVNATTPEVLDIASSGNRVFVKTANPDSVRSLDYTAPNAPFEVGFNTSVGSQKKIEALGSLVFLYDSNLVILDGNLASLPQLSSPGLTALSLAVSGTTAFASNIAQIQGLDISNPSSPSLLGSTVLSGLSVVGQGDMAIAPSKLLVANGSGVNILNATNPGGLTLDAAYLRHYLGEPLAAPVFANGRMYLLTDVSKFAGTNRAALTVLLPVSGSTPLLLGSLTFISADRPNDIAVSGDLVYAVNANKILIVDATVPASMSIIGSQNHPGGGSFGNTVAVSGSLAYAGGTSGVNIFDVSDPGSISTVGQYIGVFPNVTAVYDAKLDGSFLFCAAGTSGLQVLNVSAPSTPVLASLTSVDSADIREVYLDGVDCHVRGSEALYSFEVTVPSSPVPLGSLSLPSTAALSECGGCNKNYNGTFAVIGATGYVAAGFDGLHIVNYSDPSEPFIADSWDSSWLNYLALDSGVLYLAEDVLEVPAPGEAGLRVVNPPVISIGGDPNAGFIYATPTFPEDGEYLVLTAPSGSGYQWRRNGLDMSEDAPRVTGTQTRFLVFDPVFESDEAVYTCVYDDGSKQVLETQPYFLEVYPANSVPVSNPWTLAGLCFALACAGVGLFKRRQFHARGE